MDLTGIAAIVAAVLVAGVAAFQIALAGGAPYGEAVFGGRAPTNSGVLTKPFRLLAVIQAGVLVLLGWVLLARAHVLAIPLADSSLSRLTWVIVAFLVLNTVANFSAPHPLERWVMGPTTLVLSALASIIALGP